MMSYVQEDMESAQRQLSINQKKRTDIENKYRGKKKSMSARDRRTIEKIDHEDRYAAPQCSISFLCFLVSHFCVSALLALLCVGLTKPRAAFVAPSALLFALSRYVSPPRHLHKMTLLP